MDFRILGPLEVWDRGRPVEIRRGKQRVLLALLLLRAGEPISTDGLLDGLWGESPPATAKASLQNHVAQLRRSLGPGVLLSEGTGYRLDITQDQTDLGRFERLTAESRGETGRERVERLREALALWRGPPLADLVFEPFAAEEIGRLEELRTAVLEDAIDAELSLGRADGLIAELESLIAEHPFRERFRAQLMLALYRSGRQADALAAYREARELLLGELGIEPSRALRELEQAILRQDASLGGPAREANEAVAAPEPRRKTVTVLLADVGFAEPPDPELLREVSSSAVAAVRSVLESHGGTVEQRTGDEVMAVFGVPRAHEDDALRAARAALEARADVGPPLDIRIGIETGEVLAGADEAGHGFVAGAAITLAKRLLHDAGPGEVLVGSAARRLLGRAVKGERSSDRNTATFRLGEVVEDTAALPRNLESPLTDRVLELAELQETFAATVDEQRSRLFLLLGEPGIGKTRLSKELSIQLNRNATTLVGRCVSYGKGATYLPLAEIVRQVEAKRSLSELLAPVDHAATIEARLAELAERETSASGGETFWAVRRLFEALARDQPVVLVFEDLHWAEPTLLDLIDSLAAAKAPILLLGLARPELLDERPAWRDVAARELAPLSSDDGVALIEHLGAVPEELTTKILVTAGGNPLFIEQLLAHATDEPELETLPPSLDALLASRLDGLGPGELSVLQRAAVAGREFTVDALRQLLADGEAADLRLAALVHKGLISESWRENGSQASYTFRHVLIRDAAYATLPKTQRAELHERFALWAKAQPRRSDELIGFHLEQAHRYLAELAPDGLEANALAAEAGNYLSAAGLRAAKSRDAPAASNLMTRAISLLETGEVVRRDLLIELGIVHWLRGELDRVQQTFERALEAAISEDERRAEVRARLELAFLRLFRAPEGAADALLAHAREATSVLEEFEDDRTLGRLWYFLAYVHGGFHCRYRESAEAAERSMEYFDRAGWPLAPCLQELGASLYLGPVGVQDGIRRCATLLERADRGGEANVLVFQAGLEAMGGRFDLAREVVARAQTIYEELAWTDKISANCAAIAADIELLSGDYGAAESLLRRSCEELEASGDRARLATQASQLGEALYRQEQFEDAARWSEVAEECAATDDASAQFSWRALRAKALARQGAFDEAAALARRAVDIAATTDALSQHAQVLVDQCEVLRLGGRMAEAAAAAENAVGLLERKGNTAASRNAYSLLREFVGA